MTQHPPNEQESRADVALTVAWMLTCLSTAAAMLVVLGLRFLMALVPAAGRPHPLAAMSGILLFVASATGVACLLLTPLVLRVRRSPPPRAITIAALLISLIPILTIAALALQ